MGGVFSITDGLKTNANVMSARQGGTEMERTAVKVASGMPFKQRRRLRQPLQPSVSASMTEPD